MLTKFAGLNAGFEMISVESALGEVIREAEHITRSSPFIKHAHRAHFDYERRPGYIYVRSRAISSRTNDNYDQFPAAEIKKAYRTFIGKPVFVNHHNANHRRMRGVMIDAALHEDVNPDGTPDTWVEVLMEVDAVSFPRLAEAVVKGDIARTSMGTDVRYSVCTACGNKAETPADYCQHIPKMKGMKIRRFNAAVGKQEEVLIAEVCYGLGFFENSLLVEDPADPTAFVLGVDGVGIQAAASRKTSLLDEILREGGEISAEQGKTAKTYAPSGNLRSVRDLKPGHQIEFRDNRSGAGSYVHGEVSKHDGDSIEIHDKRTDFRHVIKDKDLDDVNGWSVRRHGSLVKKADEDQCPYDSSESLMAGGIYLCDNGHAWHPDDPAAQIYHGDGPGSGQLQPEPHTGSMDYRNMTLSDLAEEVRRRGMAVPAPGHDDHQRMETMIQMLEGKTGSVTVTSAMCTECNPHYPKNAGVGLCSSHAMLAATEAAWGDLSQYMAADAISERHMDTYATQRTAYGQPKAPMEVDTLRADRCPVCKDDEAFNGEKCSVCGHVEPPANFRDPDLTKAQEMDLRQDKADEAGALDPTIDPNAVDPAAVNAGEQPDLECDNCGEVFSAEGEASPTDPAAAPLADPAAEADPAVDPKDPDAAKADGDDDLSDLADKSDADLGLDEEAEEDDPFAKKPEGKPKDKAGDPKVLDEADDKDKDPFTDDEVNPKGDPLAPSHPQPKSQKPGQPDPNMPDPQQDIQPDPKQPATTQTDQEHIDAEHLEDPVVAAGDRCPICGQGTLSPIADQAPVEPQDVPEQIGTEHDKFQTA